MLKKFNWKFFHKQKKSGLLQKNELNVYVTNLQTQHIVHRNAHSNLETLGSSPVYLGPVAMGVLQFVYAYFLKFECSRRAPDYFTLIGGKAPPATSDRSEVARTPETADTDGV